jgi:uncharacterized protein (DUF924 family)
MQTLQQRRPIPKTSVSQACEKLVRDRVLAQSVVDFWTQELTPDDWYAGGDALDDMCVQRFGSLLQDLHEGRLEDWLADPKTIFGYILLADQLSRNIHRGSGRAFETDAKARAAAKKAIGHGWDLRVEPPARQFFYLPLEHSECLEDQDRAVRLILERLPDGASTLLHARAHREIIRRFGRFPTRNVALGRRSFEEEQQFLETGGYGRVLRELQ